MEIESIRHKPLKRFFVSGQAKGLDGNLVGRLRKMLAYIVTVENFDELLVPPNYGLHPLVGDRTGVWAMTVSRNWRMTFLKLGEHRIGELDLEDYH